MSTFNTKLNVPTSLVKKLVAAQFPKWGRLPVKPVSNSGWDNLTFHLGDKLIVRMPSDACYSSQVNKEQL